VDWREVSMYEASACNLERLTVAWRTPQWSAVARSPDLATGPTGGLPGPAPQHKATYLIGDVGQEKPEVRAGSAR
jgi:hypothetical protein